MLSKSKFSVLISTAFPGIAKILILYVIASQLGIESTGFLAYKWGIVVFMCLICVDGFSILLNSRLPQLDSVAKKQGQVISLYLNGALLILLLGIGWSIFDAQFVTSDYFLIFALFSYGFVRRTLIVIRSYSAIIIIDIISLSSSILIILIFEPKADNLAYIFIGYFVTSTIYAVKLLSLQSFNFLDTNFSFIGVSFGLNNALSGGLPLLILPFIATYYSVTTVGYISMIVSVVSVGLLVPRAISLFYLPILGEQKTSGNLKLTYRKFDVLVVKFILIFLLISPLLWIVCAPIYLSVDIFDLNTASMFFVIVIYLMLSQLSLAPSCMFSIFEIPSVVLKSNIVYFLISISFVYLTVNQIEVGSEAVVAMYSAFCTLQIIRSVYLRREINKVCL